MCIAVTAPNPSGYDGDYTFELAASIDTFYANHQDTDSLYLLDSDNKAGLFITTNLTANSNSSTGPTVQEWKNTPFSIFVHNQNDTQIQSLTSSYCGLMKNARVMGNVGSSSTTPDVEVGLTTLGNSTPTENFSVKQQFYVPGLNSSSSYYAVLGLPTKYSTPGSGPTGGGMVWRPINFTTKTGEFP